MNHKTSRFVRLTQFRRALSDRSQNIGKHIGLLTLYRGVTIAIGFLVVPISIDFLGAAQYGLWLTIFSFISWYGFFDIGIGNGLRIRLAESLATNDKDLARAYVSTAYFSLLALSFLFMSIFLIISPSVNWGWVFHSPIQESSLLTLLTIVAISFSLNLFLKLISVVYFANQNSSAPALIQLGCQILVLGFLFVALRNDADSIVTYGMIVSLSPIVVFTLVSFLSYLLNYKFLRPSLKYFRRKCIPAIMNLGGKFFVIQISATVLYSTDSFIINYFFGGAEVTVYNVALKYFSLIPIVFSIVLTPYWSAFTDAQAKRDYVWIKKSVQKLIKLAVFLVFVSAFMFFISDWVYRIWLSGKIAVPQVLTLVMFLNTAVTTMLQVCSTLINGVGKVKLQLIVGSIGAIINIPLSIFLAVTMELGPVGVILATLITNVIGLFVYPLQVQKLINRKAEGIWSA
jgi:O-antigen/teichoic acid export membrane protein